MDAVNSHTTKMPFDAPSYHPLVDMTSFEIKRESEDFEPKVDVDFHMQNNYPYIKEEDEIDIKHEECDELLFGPATQMCDEGNSMQNDALANKKVKRRKRNQVACEHCHKLFSNQIKLDSHMRKHLNEWFYKCDVCDRAFPRSGNLKNHMRTHTKEKPFPCEICKRTFSWQSSLAAHMQTHNRNTYPCEICGRDIEGKNNLLKHKRTTHAKEKPHKCQICNMSFPWKFKLTSHLRTHTKEKPFGCDVCTKSFPIKAALVRHSRIHTKEKPHACNLCSKSFSQSDHLKKHKKIHENSLYHVEVSK